MSAARLAKAVIEYNALRDERDELQTRLNDLVNGILQYAPECWGDDVAPDTLARSFVDSLFDRDRRNHDLPGHVRNCSCYS